MRAGPGLACLALVTDAFGGTGGIAQYNRDFLAVLAASQRFAALAVAPRHAGEPVETPERITQTRPRGGRLGYVLRDAWSGLTRHPGANLAAVVLVAAAVFVLTCSVLLDDALRGVAVLLESQTQMRAFVAEGEPPPEPRFAAAR